MRPFAKKLEILSWTLYGIGLFLVGCRVASRRIQLQSFRKFQIDDWIMLLVAFTFTGVIASTNKAAQNGTNYQGRVLTPAEVPGAIYGSKMLLVLEEFTLCTLWLVKACMLILYNRITLVFRSNLIVRILAWYCAIGFIFVQILFLAVWCRPLKAYWRVPLNNEQCATYHHHMIVATFFNVSSDLIMLLIPLPLLINSRLPLKRKLILCVVFSLGIFVILAAILNRYFNFAHPESPIFFNWYVGEVSTAVFVSNIPLCWPLIRHVFSLKEFGSPKQQNPSSNVLLVSPTAEEVEGTASQSRRTCDTIGEIHHDHHDYDPWLKIWGCPFTYEEGAMRGWNSPPPELGLVDRDAKVPELRDVGGLTVDDYIASPQHTSF